MLNQDDQPGLILEASPSCSLGQLLAKPFSKKTMVSSSNPASASFLVFVFLVFVFLFFCFLFFAFCVLTLLVVLQALTQSEYYIQFVDRDDDIGEIVTEMSKSYFKGLRDLAEGRREDAAACAKLYLEELEQLATTVGDWTWGDKGRPDVEALCKVR
jgi:hypothetical protein